MTRRIGSGFLGSSGFETSLANHEIVPDTPKNWSKGSRIVFYKFSFNNLADCTVKINGGDSIFIPAYEGFRVEKEDMPIHSFVVETPDVKMSWIGYY